MLNITDVPHNDRLVCHNTQISQPTSLGQVETIDRFHKAEQIGERHNPASFTVFVKNIIGALHVRDWDIKEQCFIISRTGDRLFGAFVVSDNHRPFNNDAFSTVLAFRACYDSTFARGITGGDYKYICDNLMMSGSLGNFKTKQTTFIDERQPQLVLDAVDELRPYIEKKNAFYLDLIETDINDTVAHDLFAELYRDKVFSHKELGTAIETYHEPIHQLSEGLTEAEFDKEPQHYGTAWGMYNAASHAIKGPAPAIHARKSKAIEDTTKEFFDWDYA